MTEGAAWGYFEASKVLADRAGYNIYDDDHERVLFEPPGLEPRVRGVERLCSDHWDRVAERNANRALFSIEKPDLTAA